MVRIRAFQARGPGSIPGRRTLLISRSVLCTCLLLQHSLMSFGHTMVETPDPFRTLQLSIIGLAQY